MLYSRRKFLIGASLFAGSTLAGALFWSDPFHFLAPSSSARERFLIVGAGKSACRIGLETRKLKNISLDFEPHSFLQYPQDPDRFIAVEKWGPHVAEVSFRELKVTRTIPEPPGYTFYGHGSLTATGDKLFISAVELKTGHGYVLGYSTGDFTLQSHLRVAPGRFHQFRFLPDQTLLTTSAGVCAPYEPLEGPRPDGRRVAKSALIHIDPGSGRVLGKNTIRASDQTLSHFNITKAGGVIALTAPWPGREEVGAIYFSPEIGAPLQRAELDPEIVGRMGGEVLSIAIDEERHIAALTNPIGGVVLFMDARNGRYLGNIQQQVHGIAYDEVLKGFLCTEQGLSVVTEAGTRPQSIPFTLSMDGHPPLDGKHSLLV